jgi:hypothetical protein
VAAVIKHVPDLDRGYAREGQRRDVVFEEEIYGGGFKAWLWGPARERADEEEFVRMEGIGRVIVEIVVVDGGEFFYLGFVARFFANLAEGGDARGIANISPTAGERPGSVVTFFDEEDAIVVEDSGADVNLWGGVAEISFEEIEHRVGRVGIVWGGENLGGDLADLVEAFYVEGIFGVRQAVLGYGLEALRPLEPLRISHRPYFSSSN